MASWRAHFILWFLWLRKKGNFTSAEALHEYIAQDRKHPTDHRPPKHLQTKLIIEERQVASHPVYEVSPKSETPNQARILYLHGGSFMFEIQPAHWALIATLAERLQAVVTVPIYPLGPEVKLAEQYAMLQPIYDDMAASRESSPFFAVGDSAGGCQALVLTQEALKAGKPAASALLPITPVVDATFTNPDAHDVSRDKDPWLDVVGCIETGELMRGEWSLDDPRVSPLYGDLANMPPMMVLAAENDLLGPDALRFVDKLKAAGRDVTLVEGPGMMHVWPLVLPNHEGKETIDTMMDWLEKRKA